MTVKEKPYTPPNIGFVLENRNPTEDDNSFPLLTAWLNQETSVTFQLVSKVYGADWVKFSGGSSSGSKLVSWDSSESYAVDDIVNDDGSLYVCIVVNTNKKPSANPVFWSAYSQTLVMTTITDPAINAATSTANIDDYSGVIITLTTAGNNQTLQNPTDVTPGKKFTTVVYSTNVALTIEINNITLNNGEAQTFVWSGSIWVAVQAVDADDITFTPTASITSTDVQSAIVEVEAASGISNIVEDLTPELGGNLDTNGKLIEVKVTGGGTNLSASGIAATVIAGEDVRFGELCYFKSDGKYWKSDASVETTMPVRVIVLETINANISGLMLTRGFVRDHSWNWTIGATLYASLTGGDITETAPSVAGEQVQIIGYAYSADVIYFNPEAGLLEI
jgi:hypothetical protein